MFTNKSKYDFLAAFGGMVSLLATLALIAGTVHGSLLYVRVFEAVCGFALFVYANQRRERSGTWDFLMGNDKDSKGKGGGKN